MLLAVINDGQTLAPWPPVLLWWRRSVPSRLARSAAHICSCLSCVCVGFRALSVEASTRFLPRVSLKTSLPCTIQLQSRNLCLPKSFAHSLKNHTRPLTVSENTNKRKTQLFFLRCLAECQSSPAHFPSDRDLKAPSVVLPASGESKRARGQHCYLNWVPQRGRNRSVTSKVPRCSNANQGPFNKTLVDCDSHLYHRNESLSPFALDQSVSPPALVLGRSLR